MEVQTLTFANIIYLDAITWSFEIKSASSQLLLETWDLLNTVISIIFEGVTN